MSFHLYGGLFLGIDKENSFAISSIDNSLNISQNNISLLELTSDITPTPLNQCLGQSTNVQVISGKYVFDGQSYDAGKSIAVYQGDYDLINVPSAHPILLEGEDTSKVYLSGGTVATGGHGAGRFGNIKLTVTGDFGIVSYKCAYHGYMGGQNRLTYSNECNTANLFEFEQISSNSMVLKMNRKNMLDSNQTSKISGMQLYLSGIQLENRSATQGYLNNTEKHSLLENWIVACNTIKTSAENNGNPISIAYFEINSTNTEINKENDQIDLCTLPFTSILGNVKIYNTEPYKSLVVDVLNNQVIEHNFVI